jgi:L-glyceraldehyde 3-phosphate reductase
VTEEKVAKARKLDAIAKRRGQTLAQLALAWVLRQPVMTSALVGASRVGQIEDAVGTLAKLDFSPEELREIDAVLAAG